MPDEEKLTQLHQCTIGSAREAIAHCLYNLNPNEGFTDAMSTLKKRFGNPYTILQAWIDKVLNYEEIKDNKHLQSFADALRDTLKAMKCEEELNGGRTLLQIVGKLPDDLKRKWLNENYKITESGRLPKLDDVPNLVETEAAKRANPIFGSLLSRNAPCPANTGSGSNKSGSNKSRKKQTFTTESTSESKSALTSRSKLTSNYKCQTALKATFWTSVDPSEAYRCRNAWRSCNRINSVTTDLCRGTLMMPALTAGCARHLYVVKNTTVGFPLPLHLQQQQQQQQQQPSNQASNQITQQTKLQWVDQLPMNHQLSRPMSSEGVQNLDVARLDYPF